MHVVADHGDARQRIGTIADNGGTLDRIQDFPLFDPIRLAGGEHEFARGDIDLATAKIGGIQTALDASHDLLWILVAGQHVGVGHARHRYMGITLAPSVSGRLDTGQARVHGVLDVGFQNAIFDQHVALADVAFIIDVE